MKYYLAIDKGGHRSLSDKYKKLDLSRINQELSSDNNLKALVKFTTTFETQKELKDFLLAKGILSSTNLIHDLVIYYEFSYPRTMDVAYKCDEEYLNVTRLSDIVYNNLKNKGFFDNFTSYYLKQSSLAEEVGQIREYANDPYANHLYYEAIRRLINKICYITKNGKKELNYKQLYDLGMYVSKLANKERNIIINKAEKTVTNNPQKNTQFIPEEGTAEYDKWEDWQDRLKASEENDQIKLF